MLAGSVAVGFNIIVGLPTQQAATLRALQAWSADPARARSDLSGLTSFAYVTAFVFNVTAPPGNPPPPSPPLPLIRGPPSLPFSLKLPLPFLPIILIPSASPFLLLLLQPLPIGPGLQLGPVPLPVHLQQWQQWQRRQ